MLTGCDGVLLDRKNANGGSRATISIRIARAKRFECADEPITSPYIIIDHTSKLSVVSDVLLVRHCERGDEIEILRPNGSIEESNSNQA